MAKSTKNKDTKGALSAYAKAKAALAAALGDIDYEVDEIQFIPQTYTSLSGDDAAMFEKFMDMLNDLDDVQKVYHNVE